MPGWSPAEFGQFSVPGLMVAGGVLFFIAISRGWLVPGNYHRELAASKDREIASLERELGLANERADTQAESIQIQARTMEKKDAIEVATTNILRALRDEKAST